MRATPTLAVLALLGCTGEGSLVVQIRTDLTPLREFELARVRVTGPAGATHDVVTAAVDHRAWGVGVRTAELFALPPGRHRVLARLERADGTLVVERTAQVEVSGGLRVATLLLTRSCAGVICPHEGDAPDATACLAGRCVVESCVEESAGCAEGCASDADCAGLAAPVCARVECSPSGSCFAAPDHDACAPGSVCDLRAAACVPSTSSCGRAGPWSTPVVLPLGINGPRSEYGPSLSADGLTLYYTRMEGDTSQILVARRGQPTGDFGPPEPVPSLAAMDAGEPSITANGRTLLFALRPTSGFSELWSAPIDEAGVVGAPSPLPFTPLDGEYASAPDLSEDELVLVFVSAPYGPERIAIAERSDRTQPFGPPVHLDVAEMAGGNVGWPALSADGLELIFEADAGTGTNLDLYAMRRASRTDPFGPPVRIDAASTPEIDGDADVSYDGTTLWLTSERPGGSGGGWDLWVATRTCE